MYVCMHACMHVCILAHHVSPSSDMAMQQTDGIATNDATKLKLASNDLHMQADNASTNSLERQFARAT